MKFLQSLIAIFTGPQVRLGGLLISISALFFLSGISRIGFGLGLAIAFIATYFPKAFNWLSNFVDPQFWPAFVGLGVAILFAAHTGGWLGVLACIGPLTAYDGMYFDQNY